MRRFRRRWEAGATPMPANSAVGSASGKGASEGTRWPEWMPRERFVEKVRRCGGASSRQLPWRWIDDPFAVLVSEVMLQQTQVSRVDGRWQRFMSRFPTVDALAAASVSDVLEEWQGLGYNRRALNLKRAAEACAERFRGAVPETAEELLALPGVGPSTAAGVMAFAFDKPAVYLETNVRTVFLHELFPEEEGVCDARIRPLVADSCPDTGARGWYYDLLDYGASLKSQVGNASRRSAHYVRQSSFEGSRRQKRAFVVREVLADPNAGVSKVRELLDAFERGRGREAVGDGEFWSIVGELREEGFFEGSAAESWKRG